MRAVAAGQHPGHHAHGRRQVPVFQLPALMREGLTVVISPLIALMRDQVRALRAAGCRGRGADLGQHRGGKRGGVGRARRRGGCGFSTWRRNGWPRGRPRRCCGARVRRSSRWTRRIASASGAMISGPITCASENCAAPSACRLRPSPPPPMPKPAPRSSRKLFDGTRAAQLPARVRPAQHPSFLSAAKDSPRRQLLEFVAPARGSRASSIAAPARAPKRWRRPCARPGTAPVHYHGGMEAGDRRAVEARFHRGRADRRGHGGLRDGRGQARYPLGRPCRSAQVDRGLLPGDRPRRARRRPGRDADALRPDDIRLRRSQIDEGLAPPERRAADHARLNALLPWPRRDLPARHASALFRRDA